MEKPHRHKMRVAKVAAIEKKGPTGHASGTWGIWLSRVCELCGGTDGKWAPKVSATWSGGAWLRYRELYQ